MDQQRVIRFLLGCGVIGPPLFVIVVLIEDATRPGFDPWRNWVSHLSLGDQGWINIANLVVFGLLVLCFAVGLRGAFRTGKGSLWGPLLVAAFGLSFIIAGIFPIDPGLGYPPGTGLGSTPSWHGRIHDVAGLSIFASMTAACFVLARRFAGNPRWTGWARYSVITGVLVLATFIVCSALVSLDYAGILPGAPSGLFERISLIIGCAWISLLALRLVRERLPAVSRLSDQHHREKETTQ